MTQEYTPVAWQDETTSQQGTLINAERLNQMQTAHHFADGLEEVDAIPTADPGVGYHKIVYCTADSTIYRWDGTEWTADIDDKTKALLQQEIARATAAEGELAQSIEDEATARETADSAMQADISALGDAIEAEETARGQADTALGTRITNETSARETADTGLGNRITAEATARADADTALGGRIDTEQARAEAAEQANAQAIANTYTKAEIDTLLGAKADVATTYTKTETDTLLGAKANDNAVVHLAGAETISGLKTFTTAPVLYQFDYGVGLNLKRGNLDVEGTPKRACTVIQWLDKNDAFVASIAPQTLGDKSTALGLNARNTDGSVYTVFVAPRAYNPANTNDVATIGTLDAYSPMVRTTGTQNIGGMKLFTVTPACLHASVASASGYKRIFRSKSGTLETVTNVIFGRLFARNNNTLVNWIATFRRRSSLRPTIDVDKTCGLSIALTTDGYIEIWCTNPRFNCIIDAYFADNNATFKDAVADFDNTIYLSDTGPQEDGVNYTYVTPENVTGA